MTTAKKIAQQLLEIEAISLKPTEPFTWASGLKSPIYCDNRLTMGSPKVRNFIADSFVNLIREEYPDVDVIAGTATAGIPHAAWVADRLNLPMIYIRSSAKEHGKGNQVEGVLKKGQKVVVIEDLISTGGSVLEACSAIEAEGGDVMGVLAIFTYQLSKSTTRFSEANIPLHTLSTYDALIDSAVTTGKINNDELALLKKWRDNPSDWQ